MLKCDEIVSALEEFDAHTDRRKCKGCGQPPGAASDNCYTLVCPESALPVQRMHKSEGANLLREERNPRIDGAEEEKLRMDGGLARLNPLYEICILQRHKLRLFFMLISLAGTQWRTRTTSVYRAEERRSVWDQTGPIRLWFGIVPPNFVGGQSHVAIVQIMPRSCERFLFPLHGRCPVASSMKSPFVETCHSALCTWSRLP